jgi:hypothetical protein
MLTGTPLDLTPFGALFQGAGLLYLALAVALAALALRLIKRRWLKYAAALVILAAFTVPPARLLHERKQAVVAVNLKLLAARAHFEMRCKGAGEKIVRTVDKVEGVVWMKWRDKMPASIDNEQFDLFDPYGRDCEGPGCIEQLLRLEATGDRFERELGLRRGRYRYVESVDPADGKRYRYVGAMKLPVPPWTPEAIARQEKTDGTRIGDDSYRFATARVPIERYSARYGITWDDISTREDREHWVAGGSIKVVDLQTNEVIAERIGYLMDPGLGSRDGFRAPWRMARRHACPEYPGGMLRYPTHDSVLFALRVLQPTQ